MGLLQEAPQVVTCKWFTWRPFIKGPKVVQQGAEATVGWAPAGWSPGKPGTEQARPARALYRTQILLAPVRSCSPGLCWRLSSADHWSKDVHRYTKSDM